MKWRRSEHSMGGRSNKRGKHPPIRSRRPRRAGQTHITPAGGNVFSDLGFGPAEAENLKLRAILMDALSDISADMTQVEAARLLGVTQPRVSALRHGKIELFTV